MNRIKAIIIDDEISAIKTLKGMVNEYFPKLDIVAHASFVDEALLMVQKYEPDLVFLDIEMPPFGSGFDFLQKCHNRKFGVIFVTAYPKYAIKAINDAQPWAYLVKPYSVSELLQAVKIAVEKIDEILASDKPGEIISDIQSIIMPDARKGNIVIRLHDILYCKADKTTIDLFFQRDGNTVKISSYRSLKDIEETLPQSSFCRCHHSYLVNLAFVERYERTGRNGTIHLLKTGEIPISVSRMEEFERKFSKYLHLR